MLFRSEGFKEQGCLIFSCNTAHPTITLQLFTESCYLAFRLLCGIDVKGSMFHIWVEIVYLHQARLQQYMNRELPDVQPGFRKGRGTTDQIANIHWIMEKAREFQKNIYFCFIDYAKAFDCVDHNQLWKILIRAEQGTSLETPSRARVT